MNLEGAIVHFWEVRMKMVSRAANSTEPGQTSQVYSLWQELGMIPRKMFRITDDSNNVESVLNSIQNREYLRKAFNVLSVNITFEDTRQEDSLWMDLKSTFVSIKICPAVRYLLPQSGKVIGFYQRTNVSIYYRFLNIFLLFQYNKTYPQSP